MNQAHPSVILVTGAATGIGQLSACSLAEAGHTVYASMRDVTARNAARARKELDYAQSHGVDLHVVERDVTSQESANWKTQCLPMRLQNRANGLNKGIRSFKRHKVPNAC